MNDFRDYIGRSTKDFAEYEGVDDHPNTEKSKPHRKRYEGESADYYKPKKKKRK